MNRPYFVSRTERRKRIVRTILLITLLIAAGYYILTNSHISSAGALAWVLGLALWLLKCFLIAQAVLIMAVTLVIWGATLRLIGLDAIRGAPTMLRLGRLSMTGQGWRNSAVYTLLTVILIVAWLSFRFEILIFFSILTASIAISDIVGSSRIVGVLFLSRSGRLNLSYQVELKEAAMGLRVVSLLDQRFEPDRSVKETLISNIYRTTDSADWRELIQELMDLAQIIVLDTRECSPALHLETQFAVLPSRHHKVLALTGEDGSAPLLEDYMKLHDDPRVHSLPRLTEIQLLAEVHRRARSRLYPAGMQGRQISIQSGRVPSSQPTPAKINQSRVLIPALQRSYDIPNDAAYTYTPAEMKLALSSLYSVSLHLDYPDNVEELDTASSLIRELLLPTNARWVPNAEEAEATIWIQKGSAEMRYVYVVADPRDVDRYIAAECGPRELTACIVTAICQFLRPQASDVPAAKPSDLVATINDLNRALTKAMLTQDEERLRQLMLELKIAIERLGSTRSADAIRPVVAAIADSAAAYEHIRFAEAHALLESSIEAAYNIGPPIIPMLKRGANDPNPAVRRAFEHALRRLGAR